MGYHLAPTANQDNHFRTWGTITEARTAVIATALDKDVLLEAMRNRHVYATLDRNLKIVASVQGRLIGSILEDEVALGEDLAIEITISDDDEPNSTYWVEVYVDEIDGLDSRRGNQARRLGLYGPIRASDDGPPDVWSISDIDYEGWDYMYMRVYQEVNGENRRQAWLAPVWFE